MSSNTVQFTLGTEADLTPLYPFKPPSIPLEDFIGLCLNQTLQRDGLYGAWAQVWWSAGNVEVVITSPDPDVDVTPYVTVYPQWLAAVSTALTAYNAVYAKISPPPPAPPDPAGIAFLAPFGLAMLNTRSVQLLHYPPTETLSFVDYLYSPTNRRWESLLVFNGSAGSQNTLLETITDLIPVAANGGSSGSTAIGPFASAFGQYVPQMLNVFLRPSPGGKATQPVVGYGGPVMSYLQSTYKPVDISPVTGHPTATLAPLSLFLQQFMQKGPLTPVLCANHPSKFMYYPSQNPPTDYTLILQQDLTAARWQVQMAQNPDADPVATLGNAWNYWTSSDQTVLLNTILAEQIAEFTRPSSTAKPQAQKDSQPPYEHRFPKL